MRSFLELLSKLLQVYMRDLDPKLAFNVDSAFLKLDVGRDLTKMAAYKTETGCRKGCWAGEISQLQKLKTYF